MERSKSLSIHSVKTYKIFTIVTLSGFVIFYIFFLGLSDSLFNWILAAGYVVLSVFIWFPQYKKFFSKIKEVAYDTENLYVKEGDYEIQIPFHQVKDIEIISFDGLYRFKLYHHDQFGSEVICKPSLWYPFNYKRVDAELNRIRSLVRKAHWDYKDQIGVDKALPSN